MVAVAFTAIASNVGAGPIALALVSTVGSYIDNRFLFNDSKDHIEPANLNLQNSAEGGPALGLIGQECRVRGQIIFQSRVYGSEVDPKVDIALAIANDGTVLDGAEIVRIYADGYEIFTGSGTLTSGKLDDLAISHFVYVSDPGAAGVVIGSQLSATSTGFDLTKFRTFGGYGLAMKGWGDNGNNWGFGGAGGPAGNNRGRVDSVNKYNDGSTVLRCLRLDHTTAPATKVNEFAGTGLTPEIIQTVTPINPAFATDVEIKDGTPGQVVSEIIRSHNIDTPAMEGTVYAVIEGFRIAQFGQRVPDVISIASTSATPVTVAEAVDTIYERAGHAHTLTGHLDWDTSELDANRIVRGYTITEEGSVEAKLQPLVFAYDLSMQVRDGVAFYFHQENSRFFDVDVNDWGAVSEEPGDDGLTFSPLTKAHLPSKVSVNFVDSINGWEDASVDRHISSPAIVSEDTVEIDLRSLTMTMEEAVAIAERLLYRPHRLGRPWRGALPAHYLYILENDIIDTTFNGRAIQLKVDKVERGQDRTLRFEGRVFLPDPPRSVGF